LAKRYMAVCDSTSTDFQATSEGDVFLRAAGSPPLEPK